MAQDQFTVIIRGNLGKDPEWIGTSGKAIKVSVGVKRKEKGQDVTVWQSVTFFNNDKVKMADWVAAQMRKGSKVRIEGRGTYNKYTPQGASQEVRAFEVLGDSFDVIESRQQQPHPQQQPVAPQQQSYPQQQPMAPQQQPNNNGYAPTGYQQQ